MYINPVVFYIVKLVHACLKTEAKHDTYISSKRFYIAKFNTYITRSVIHIVSCTLCHSNTFVVTYLAKMYKMSLTNKITDICECRGVVWSCY